MRTCVSLCVRVLVYELSKARTSCRSAWYRKTKCCFAGVHWVSKVLFTVQFTDKRLGGRRASYVTALKATTWL